jgi:hypothetical protein
MAVVDGITTTSDAGIELGTSEAGITTGLAGSGVSTTTKLLDGRFDGMLFGVTNGTENCALYETDV